MKKNRRVLGCVHTCRGVYHTCTHIPTHRDSTVKVLVLDGLA